MIKHHQHHQKKNNHLQPTQRRPSAQKEFGSAASVWVVGNDHHDAHDWEGERSDCHFDDMTIWQCSRLSNQRNNKNHPGHSHSQEEHIIKARGDMTFNIISTSHPMKSKRKIKWPGSQSQPGGRGDLHWQSTHLSPAGHKLQFWFELFLSFFFGSILHFNWITELIFGATAATGGRVNFFVSCVNF